MIVDGKCKGLCDIMNLQKINLNGCVIMEM